MKTKIELQNELMMVEHDVRHHRNNMIAFGLRGNIEQEATSHNRMIEAESKCDHLRNNIEDCAD